MHCELIYLPMGLGAGMRGCEQAPKALREAGLSQTIRALGHSVSERSLPGIVAGTPLDHANGAIKNLAETAAWTAAIAETAYQASATAMPIFVGGDHAISAGTVTGVARRARELNMPFFVLWIDAHSDFHTLHSTQSGNLHGVPLAYAAGLPGFDGVFPKPLHTVLPSNITILGARSVDPPEQDHLAAAGVTVFDMRDIDEQGIAALVRPLAARIRDLGGWLHVSFDADVLDPSIAPGVGTAVPGGLTLREAHLVMELLSDAGVVRSLDIVELNPTLDTNGATARVLVDLSSSLMGRAIMRRRHESQ